MESRKKNLCFPSTNSKKLQTKSRTVAVRGWRWGGAGEGFPREARGYEPVLYSDGGYAK